MKTLHTIVCTAIFLLLSLSGATAAPRQETLRGPIPAEVVKVLDGDTLAVQAHVWIGEKIEISVRIDGIDAPEMKGRCQKESALAEAARQEVISLTSNPLVEIYDVRLEKYAGRVLAHVRTAAGVNIARHMIEKGLARPYHGKKRQPWCLKTVLNQ